MCRVQLAKTQGNVFITDAIMSAIMCATRSVYSWDVIVQKVGKKLFFDKRDDSEFGNDCMITISLCRFCICLVFDRDSVGIYQNKDFVICYLQFVCNLYRGVAFFLSNDSFSVHSLIDQIHC